MTEVIEGNRLIAEFMGYDVQRYDQDWNELMPVVEKIESDFDPTMKTWIQINGRHCDVWNYFDVTEILREAGSPQDKRFKVRGNGKTKLEAVYDAVTQFIHWYNSNKPT